MVRKRRMKKEPLRRENEPIKKVLMSISRIQVANGGSRETHGTLFEVNI